MADPTDPLWPELRFDAWQDTRATLQLWTQIVGKIRLMQTPWLNHSWHVPLYVNSRGLTTSTIAHGSRSFEIQFDFIEHVLDKFVPEGVDPKTRALEAYIAAREPVLSKVLSPEEIEALSDRAAQATGAAKEVEAAQAGRQEALKGVSAEGEKALKDAVAARKAMMAKYGNKDLGKLARTSSDDDAINIVRSIIGADDGAARMASLAKEVEKTPGGTDALKKTVAEVIKREASTTTEAGTSGMMQMDRRALHGFMSTRTGALKAAGLSDHQVGILRAVTEDALQANRTISAVKSKGGSDTDSLNAMREKLAKPGHGSMLGHIAVDSALAGAGHLAGGLFDLPRVDGRG